MSLSIRSVAAAMVALVLPSAAIAQQQQPLASDVNYCNTLAGLYNRYVVGYSGTGSQGTPDLTVEGAITQCGTDPANSIPVLEKVLKNNDFTLPPRK